VTRQDAWLRRHIAGDVASVPRATPDMIETSVQRGRQLARRRAIAKWLGAGIAIAAVLAPLWALSPLTTNTKKTVGDGDERQAGSWAPPPETQFSIEMPNQPGWSSMALRSQGYPSIAMANFERNDLDESLLNAVRHEGDDAVALSIHLLVPCDCVGALDLDSLGVEEMRGRLTADGLLFSHHGVTLLAHATFGSVSPTASLVDEVRHVLKGVGVSEASAEQPANGIPSPRFREKTGWYALSSAAKPTFLPLTWLSTKPFAIPDVQASEPPGMLVSPYDSLVDLGPDDVFITASYPYGDQMEPASPVFPERQLPVTLEEADSRVRYEGQAASNVPEYVIWTTIDGIRVDIRVYFGTLEPSQATLNVADSMLAELQPPTT
jgi:hypothetical protein